MATKTLTLMSRCALLMVCLFQATFSGGQTKSDLFAAVNVEGGLISGSVLPEGIHSFKGIPFAAPPTGSLRWRPPQPVKPWKGKRECVRFGASPMQDSPKPFSMWSREFLIPDEPISEDCLYLNVWTGARSGQEKRPVLVWIYGGGFMSGGSGVPIYDGAASAVKGVVFVSINYRVGIFGFFAHPELTRESPSHSSGNYGLMDQIAALKWVKKNISAFGGDPDNVTIAGQSAGSMSVNCLVASPLAKNLFKKAIAESGAAFSRQNVPLSLAEEDGVKVAAQLQAPSLKALRDLSAAALMKGSPAYRRPIVDGYVLPEPVGAIFAEKKENHVSLLTGWNENEGLLFEPVQTAAAFKKRIEDTYGSSAAEALSYYPAVNDSVATISQLALARDALFGSQNYAWANAQNRNKNSVYVYRFARKVPATGEYKKYGAFHTGEVPYALDNLRFVDRPWEDADRRLAKAMSAYWINFAKSGDPNGAGLPTWKPFLPAKKEIMLFDEVPHSSRLPDARQLDFLLKSEAAGG